MTGWETIVAAIGGLLLGFGLGAGLSKRREDRVHAELRRAESQLRAAVIPVLAERADALGVTPEGGLDAVDDAVRVSVSLASAVRSAQGDHHLLPYTDTVEFDALDPNPRPR